VFECPVVFAQESDGTASGADDEPELTQAEIDQRLGEWRKKLDGAISARFNKTVGTISADARSPLKGKRNATPCTYTFEVTNTSLDNIRLAGTSDVVGLNTLAYSALRSMNGNLALRLPDLPERRTLKMRCTFYLQAGQASSRLHDTEIVPRKSRNYPPDLIAPDVHGSYGNALRSRRHPPDKIGPSVNTKHSGF